jgi:hypothetical protein
LTAQREDARVGFVVNYYDLLADAGFELAKWLMSGSIFRELLEN